MRKARTKRVNFAATGGEILFSKLTDHIPHFINVRENLHMDTVSYETNKIHDMREHNKEVLHRHLQTWLICCDTLSNMHVPALVERLGPTRGR